MGRHKVCLVKELPSGMSRIERIENRSIGLYNIKGEFYAIRNSCPHQGAELCQGKIQGMMLPSDPGEYLHGREGEIVRCPWHGWEFDIKNGKSVFDPFRCLVKTYAVEVVGEDDEASPGVETFPVEVESGWIVVIVS
ncbi:Rieske (2Fe-2S) protein [Paenibacillus sepulcri]|uniref:Rieske (2Fe-2S) protein n=1 Tax=Paenibacillus sepulcri TaxID=359917 RepID=A0ABS7BX10_9BACL|nr:Rieske (2Fe-2S) protein [Paenibacillus sepulcri]